MRWSRLTGLVGRPWPLLTGSAHQLALLTSVAAIRPFSGEMAGESQCDLATAAEGVCSVLPAFVRLVLVIVILRDAEAASEVPTRHMGLPLNVSLRRSRGGDELVVDFHELAWVELDLGHPGGHDRDELVDLHGVVQRVEQPFHGALAGR